MCKPHSGDRCRVASVVELTADVVLHAVRAHHHGQRVPADEALDAALQFLVAGKKRLQAYGNRIRVRSIGAERQGDAVDRGVRAEPLKNFCGPPGSAGFQDGMPSLQPFLNLTLYPSMSLGPRFV